MLLFENILFAQNLLQNGSFENYTNIDCANGGFDRGTAPFTHVVDNWFDYNSADYFNSICSPGGYSVPNSYLGSNYSKNGNAFAGLVAYANGSYVKEYIYQQLTQPLQSGKIYCLSFYVNRADRFTYAIKSIGALFTNSLQATTNGWEINAVPQVENQNGYLTDTTQWVEVQGCFTANGGEQYITIGNFTTNYNTDTLNTNSTNLIPGRETVSYYYIDDVSLIDQTTVGVNETEKENNFEISPNPNNGIFKITGNDIQKIEVINIAGQLLLQESINSKTHQLQLNQFTQGIYFIKVHYANGLSVNKKVIVNP